MAQPASTLSSIDLDYLRCLVGSQGGSRGMLSLLNLQELRNNCRQYGLEGNGGKETLQKRLGEYAIDQLNRAEERIRGEGVTAVAPAAAPMVVEEDSLMINTEQTANPLDSSDFSIGIYDESASPIVQYAGPARNRIRVVQNSPSPEKIQSGSLDPDATIDETVAQRVFGRPNDVPLSQHNFDAAIRRIEVKTGNNLAIGRTSSLLGFLNRKPLAPKPVSRFDDVHQRQFDLMPSIVESNTRKRPAPQDNNQEPKQSSSLTERARKRIKATVNSITSATCSQTSSNESMDTKMAFGMRETGFIAESENFLSPPPPAKPSIQFSNPPQNSTRTPKMTAEQRKRRLSQQAKAKRRSSGVHVPVNGGRPSIGSARKPLKKAWHERLLGMAKTRPSSKDVPKVSVGPVVKGKVRKEPSAIGKPVQETIGKVRQSSRPPPSNALPRFAQQTASSRMKASGPATVAQHSRSEASVIFSPRNANSVIKNARQSSTLTTEEKRRIS